MADMITHALQLDATDEKALRAAGIQDVDVAVVSIGESIESSLLVVMQLRELGVKTIIAKAVTPLHGRILKSLVSRASFSRNARWRSGSHTASSSQRHRLHRAVQGLQYRGSAGT